MPVHANNGSGGGKPGVGFWVTLAAAAVLLAAGVLYVILIAPGRGNRNTMASSPAPARVSSVAPAASAVKTEYQTTSSGPAVEDAYFADAVFIGDSRVEGLAAWGSFPGAKYLAHKGLMVNTILTKPAQLPGFNDKILVLDAIKTLKFSKVYVMLGINEIGYPYDKKFIEGYEGLIDGIRAVNPQTVVYCQAIMPVTQAKSDSDKTINNANIARFNKLIQTVAQDKGTIYLDAAEAVCGPDGTLLNDATTDGVHLNAAYCQKWRDFLRTHTAAR